MNALSLSLVLWMLFNVSIAQASTCEIESEQLQISAVYPTAETLPENLLRFYVYFSRPMLREDILKSIYLANEKGEKLEGVFLENRFNLWSPDSTRLTLLFDPGRVKTGLVAYNEMGHALTPGSEYQLIIDKSVMSVAGCTLERQFIKEFNATKANYELPDIEQWSLSQPIAGTHDALNVTLNGSMDHVSLAYRLRVKDREGEVISGSIALSKQETMWIFVPEKPWRKRPYRLVVDPMLEDISGNRITGLFEQPLLMSGKAELKNWIKIDIQSAL
ncbi:hypothetical protein [Shewanella nanhaiensis]|uniref:SbsA Ig-like domain-containing protein n=1 Tax=Shewanella nanhaiensis TaxID=2864872 RepID=A0ABS7E2L1_9GAMM|nr:hypothetical protein [Shewanella nanhaiensis]MBW8183790.1 hypothetical protein [Shewanella nanhaiensis]